GLFLYPQGGSPEFSQRRDGYRFCLSNSLGSRPALFGRQGERTTCAVEIYSSKRRYGRDHHNSPANSEPRLAEAGQDPQSEIQDSQLDQSSAAGKERRLGS